MTDSDRRPSTSRIPSTAARSNGGRSLAATSRSTGGPTWAVASLRRPVPGSRRDGMVQVGVEEPLEGWRHTHPLARRRPQPAHPREEHRLRQEQHRRHDVVDAVAARQRLTLPVELRLQQGLVGRGVGPRPLLQGFDECLLRRLDACGPDVLDGEPRRRHDDHEGGHEAQPRAHGCEPLRPHTPAPAVGGCGVRSRRACSSTCCWRACHSRNATGIAPPRRSISRGQVS